MNENENRFMEPVLNSGNPKWLIITKNHESDIQNDPRPLKEKIEDPCDPILKIEFETKKPNIWECKKCLGQFESEEKPYHCNQCNRDSSFNRITKDINITRWKLPKWKDIPIEDIDMIMLYHDMLDLIKRCIIFPDEMQYELFTLWIIASYKKECFDTIPFLIFRGLIESGKTRALDILRELGYRMIHTTGVTFAAMCRYTHFHGAGILIDEIDNKIDKRTESGREYLDFLKPSYKRGSVYACADKEDQEETKEYYNYGFKAFAGEKGGYDRAVFSRSIDFQMEKEYPDIPELKYVQNDLDQFQTILLNYRYKFTDPSPLELEYPLKGRDREIFSALIQTATHIGLDDGHILAYIKQRKQEQIEDIQNSDEYEVLKAICDLMNNTTGTLLDDAREHLSYSDIADQCGWDTGTDVGRKKVQRLGYMFKKKLMLRTKRHGQGTVLLLNDNKNMHKLNNYFRRYHVN